MVIRRVFLFIGTYLRQRDRIGTYRQPWTGKHYGKQVLRL